MIFGGPRERASYIQYERTMLQMARVYVDRAAFETGAGREWDLDCANARIELAKKCRAERLAMVQQEGRVAA